MTDTEPTNLLSELAPQMYKATTENITFSKRQQWAILLLVVWALWR